MRAIVKAVEDLIRQQEDRAGGFHNLSPEDKAQVVDLYSRICRGRGGLGRIRRFVWEGDTISFVADDLGKAEYIFGL